MNFFRTDHVRFSAWKIFFVLACITIHLQYNLVESASLKKKRAADTEACRSYCKTSNCHLDASFYLSAMNTSVDPCDNFYEFVCGNYINKTKLSDSEAVQNLFDTVRSQVITELYVEIRKEIQPTDLDAFKKVKTYYKNCLNEALIEREGTKPMFKSLNITGGWPFLLGKDWDESKFDWAESVYKLRENAFPSTFPIKLDVVPDRKNSTKRILQVTNYNTNINKMYMMEGPEGKYFKNYFKFMTRTALALGANLSNIDELTDMVKFEIDLFEMQMTPEEATEKSVGTLMTVKELSQNYPSIPWLKLFNKMLQPSITIDEDEVVSVADIDYLGKVEKLLQNTPKRTVANFLAWEVAHSILGYMPTELQKVLTDFMNGLTGTTGTVDRESKCLNEVMKAFPIAVSSLYVNKYFNNPEIKKSAYDLVQDLKEQTKRNLETVDWMDDETRKAALRKLDAMTVNVGYAEELMSAEKVNGYYEDIVINPGGYLESVLNATTFYLNKNYADLRKPVDKNVWTMHASSVYVNAYYQLQLNRIEIPAGILKWMFFNSYRPRYLNYGALGTVIGHEVTHAFDSTGRKYDEHGNYANWWQPETEQRFLSKVQCIIEQYNNFTVKEVGMNVNGVLTQGENIADNGGFKTAYHAYNEWVSRNNNIYEHCLPGLNYSPRQMFWISAAYTWCTKQRPEYLEDIIATNEHSPNSARIIISFSNMKEFADDFQCKVGTLMNPEKKCVVW